MSDGTEGAALSGAEGQQGAGEGGGNEGPSQEVISKASEMGWVPKDKFRGDPERWVDADEYVRKGEEVMPILRANNKKLNEQLSLRDQQLQETRAQLDELKESLTVLQEVQTRESTARIDRQIKTVQRQIEEARAERETDRVLELTDQLEELTAEKGKLAAPKEEKPSGSSAAPSTAVKQEISAWQDENTWYGTNVIKTALADSISQKLRRDQAYAGKVGKAFLDEVTRQTEEIYSREIGGRDDGKSGDDVSKVLPGSNSGTRAGNGGTRKGKGFNDLPAEAKAACKSDAERLVGANKAFKTEADYQSWYVKEYFGDEA